MNVTFEHNFQKKVMLQRFVEETRLSKDADVLSWRALWMAELKSWHSPYKALIDCSNLYIDVDQPGVKAALERTLKLFEGFFLKKAVGFGFDEAKGHAVLPFKVFASQDEAAAEVGLLKIAAAPGRDDFRSLIQLQNHFRHHTVELTFAQEAVIDSLEKLNILKSKLTNNLMQWHSKWNLIVDVSHLKIAAELHGDFAKMEKFFKGVFLKQIIGYGSRIKDDYPFPVYISRHKAAAFLEAEGNFSGDEAECLSKKP